MNCTGYRSGVNHGRGKLATIPEYDGVSGEISSHDLHGHGAGSRGNGLRKNGTDAWRTQRLHDCAAAAEKKEAG